MDIVIAGAGDIGLHLAKMLSAEEHDIMLMDLREERLEYADSHFEILTKLGSCSSIKDLQEAGVHKSRLFIAVTHSEETNITAAILAKKIGAKKVVARIDNREYLEAKEEQFLKELGIDALVYPEKLASDAIVNSLKMTGADLLYEFSEKKLVLFSIKLNSHSVLVDKTMKEAKKIAISKRFRTVAIKREGETIIPKKFNRFQENDELFVLSLPESTKEAIDLCGCQQFKLKNIMIVGGSRIGQKTAMALENKYNIKLIEIDKKKSFSLADELSKTLVVKGDGRDLQLLQEEGISNMDVFIAVTGNSETNILSSLLAKRAGVKGIIAEVENMDFIDLADTLGVSTMINKKLISASTIYQYTTEAAINHFKQLTNIEALELVAKEGSKITQKPIREFDFKKATVGGIIRDSEAFIAYGEMRIKAGDKVILFALPKVMRKIEKLFN